MYIYIIFRNELFVMAISPACVIRLGSPIGPPLAVYICERWNGFDFIVSKKEKKGFRTKKLFTEYMTLMSAVITCGSPFSFWVVGNATYAGFGICKFDPKTLICFENSMFFVYVDLYMCHMHLTHQKITLAGGISLNGCFFAPKWLISLILFLLPRHH